MGHATAFLWERQQWIMWFNRLLDFTIGQPILNSVLLSVTGYVQSNCSVFERNLTFYQVLFLKISYNLLIVVRPEKVTKISTSSGQRRNRNCFVRLKPHFCQAQYRIWFGIDNLINQTLGTSTVTNEVSKRVQRETSFISRVDDIVWYYWRFTRKQLSCFYSPGIFD